jgi:hypothetical protein
MLEGSKFHVYEKDNIYGYRNCFETNILPIEKMTSCVKHSHELDINNRYGDYFTHISFKFVKGFNFNKCKVNKIKILAYSDNMKSLSDVCMNIHSSTRKILMKIDGEVVEVGKISDIAVLDLEGQKDASESIQALINYFHTPTIYYVFNLEFENYKLIQFLDNIDLFIPMSKHVKLQNFICYNFIFLTNLEQVQSNAFNFKTSTKQITYIDYLTRDTNKIFKIHNLYAYNFDTAIKTSVQNFIHYSYDEMCPVLQNVYWLHHYDYKNRLDSISIEIPNINSVSLQDVYQKTQYFYIADKYQVINRKFNISKIICISNNKILLDKILFGPTFYRDICLDNTRVLDNLFIIHNPDLLHTRNKRGILLNILNSLSYLFDIKVSFDKVISKITINHEFVESIVNNQYMSNVVTYKIKIIIEDVLSIDYAFYSAISKFIIGLFGISTNIHIIFYNLQETNIIYDEYTSQQD